MSTDTERAAAHTPGPWQDDQTTGPNPRITGGPLRLIKSGGFVIAFVPMWLDDEAEEARANARAMTAAPDLLAALQAMCDRWEPDTEGADRRMWEAACAAIQKATGSPA